MGWQDTCCADDCDRIVGRHGAKGYCPKHYYRLWKHGSPEGGHASRFYVRGQAPWERMCSKFDKHPNGCWLWSRKLNPQGYAVFWDGKRSWLAHVWMYQFVHGPIPDEYEIDHTCHNGSGCPGGNDCPHRACVNPDHLEAVTHRTNALRGESFSARNARKTECPSGHPYDEANTRWYRNARYCIACAHGGRDPDRTAESRLT